jgi:hypothetical protein
MTTQSSQNKIYIFKPLPNFRNIQPPATAKPLEIDRTHCQKNTLINANFSKMESILVQSLQFRNYDHVFGTNTTLDDWSI